MKGRTSALLALLGTVGAGLTAYVLRDRSTGWQILGAGSAFALPWVLHSVVRSPSCVFLFVTDTHGSAQANQPLIEAMLTEKNVSFVAHGGDVVDSADLWHLWWDNPFRPIREKWPVYAASGNHDVDTTANAAEFRDRFGSLPRSVVCGNAEVFFLPWGTTRSAAEWLWVAVERSTATRKILVLHRPVWPMRDDDVRQRELIMPVLNRVELVLAGHEHAHQDSMHDGVRQVIEVSGPKKYECPEGASGCVDHSTGYLRVEVYEDGISVRRRAV